MRTTVSVVPFLTRADLLAIEHFNAGVRRARAEYERDPFAATTEDSTTCVRCREKKHHRCSGTALRRAKGHVYEAVTCACWLDEHETRTT